MTEITFTDNELDSLKLIVNYLIDNEERHYEESEEPADHIYLHIKRVERVLEKTKDTDIL